MFELLRNAEVFAPDALGAQHLLICAERIVYMGSELPALPQALEVRETDLRGARVVPGLIDAHVHLIGGGGEAGPESRVPPLQLSRITRGGTTSVVGLLGTDDLTRSTADLLAQTRGLRAEGLSAWCYTGGYHLPPATLTGSVRGDIVHLDPVIGVGELAISDHRSSQPTLDELLRVASEAHVAGLMTGKAGTVHLHLGDGERGLALVRAALDRSEIPARVFHPTHVNRRKPLFEEAMALSERGCTVDITAFPPSTVGEGEHSAADALALYLDAGLPADRVTVSSDGGGCLPQFDAQGQIRHYDVGEPAELAGVLKQLLAQGHPLERLLPAFTSNVAALLRFPRKGRIAVGHDADLLILDADGGVRDVMARGRWHWRDGACVRAGRFEGPAPATS